MIECGDLISCELAADANRSGPGGKQGAISMAENILQYESTIWNTADLLRGCGIKESEWPSYMMPFFALSMIESRLLRMLDKLDGAGRGDGFLRRRYRPTWSM